MKSASALAALLALSACGGQQSAADNSADQLEQAAEQSDPAAARVLEDAADQVRDGEANAQQALQNAGNAQAQTLPQPQPAPPSMQAKPRQPGDPTPPPKQPAKSD